MGFEVTNWFNIWILKCQLWDKRSDFYFYFFQPWMTCYYTSHSWGHTSPFPLKQKQQIQDKHNHTTRRNFILVNELIDFNSLPTRNRHNLLSLTSKSTPQFTSHYSHWKRKKYRSFFSIQISFAITINFPQRSLSLL